MTESVILTRTIAISAIYEIALTIKDLAWHGLDHKNAIDTRIKPILHIEGNNQSALDIYESVDHIRQGIQSFHDSIKTGSSADREVNRYVYSLIYLAGKLNKNPNMLSYISRELDHIRKLTGENEPESEDDNFYTLDHEHILRLLATIYQNSISKLGPRILISGKSDYLAQEQVAQTIRALLLSGIRSAILWHRHGGSRLKLLFNRTSYINSCIDLLAK